MFIESQMVRQLTRHLGGRCPSFKNVYGYVSFLGRRGDNIKNVYAYTTSHHLKQGWSKPDGCDAFGAFNDYKSRIQSKR